MNVTVAVPDALLVADTDVGVPGTVAGITANDGAEVSDVATPLLAVTANVYEVPFVKPVHE